MHHRAYFLPQQSHDQYAVETKDFIPHAVDWFKNPIPAPDAFEEGNMANISPTIKIDISVKPGIEEYVTLGTQCTPEEIEVYTKIFEEFRDIFTRSYSKMPSLDPAIVEHHIDTWPDANPVRQNLRPIHPSRHEAIKDKNK